MTSSPDHFSTVAAQYAEFRPTYPPELFRWLSDIAPSKALAWDCACGSGQASLDLAKRFDRVVATDISAAQVDAAPRHPKVEYRVQSAEEVDLPAGAVDLVTVAQALHWIQLERFYGEVRRVLKSGGILAVWSYGILTVQGEEVNRAVSRYYHDIVGPYWPAGRKHVEEGYRSLPFPYPEVPTRAFRMQVDWDLERLLGYARSWSATARYAKAHGTDPVRDLERELRKLWAPCDAPRRIVWPLALRVGHSPTA